MNSFPLLLLPVPDYIFLPLTLTMAFIALLSAGTYWDSLGIITTALVLQVQLAQLCNMNNAPMTVREI